MKLLLDEMWSPVIAQQLRLRGFDVIAVTERPDLRGESDEVIFATAQVESRAIVTENASDFRRIAAEAVQRGVVHGGLILTSNHQISRRDDGAVGRLVNSLLELLNEFDGLSGLERWL